MTTGLLLLGADPLSCFLRARPPFVWAGSDCLTTLADWIREARGIDPARELRSLYFDARGAARIVRDAGGMAGLIDRQLKPFGIVRTEKPKRGDIALVRVIEENETTKMFDELTGAIVLEGSTVGFSDQGPLLRTFAAAPIVAAWGIFPAVRAPDEADASPATLGRMSLRSRSLRNGVLPRASDAGN